MIRSFINNPVAVLVLCLAILLFGLLALFDLPIQLTPDVSTPKITVGTRFPGATPEDVEQDILIEQERFLKNIPGLVSMVSTASMGSAEIILEFGLETDEQENVIRVNNALTQVSGYPENVDEPSITTASADDQPIAWLNVRVRPESLGKIDINDYLDYANDYVKPEFERIDGVSGVRGVFGASSRQLQVFLNPEQLAERGLSVFHVREAIRSRNRDVSGGDLAEGKRTFNVRTLGRYESPEQLEDTIVANGPSGPVRLRDVGFAKMGRAEERSMIRIDGQAALGFGIKHQRGSNMLVVMDRVKAKIVELNEGMLDGKGVMIGQATDDTIYVHEAVKMVRENLFLGGGLAVLVLLLFLRHVRSTIVLAIAIPLSLVGSFFLIDLAGRSINVISLAGLAFSIGVVLDASIVVLENIFRHRTLGKSAPDAAHDGASEVWTAILSSSLTNVVVFAPILTLQDEAGQLFRDIAIAIISANVLSLVVSIVVIPPLAARMLRTPPQPPRRRMSIKGLFGLVSLVTWFHEVPSKRFFHWMLESVGRRVFVVGSTLISAWALIILFMPRTEYLPEGNSISSMALVIPPQGYGISELQDIGEWLEGRVQPLLDADADDYAAGRVDGPPLQRLFVGAFGNIMLMFTSPKDHAHAAEVPAFMRKQLAEIPGVIGIASQNSIFGGGFTGSRVIEVNVTGPDIITLTGLARGAFFSVFSALPGAQPRPRPGIEIGQPQITIRPDWERAAELGLNPRAIGYSAWVIGDGAWADEHYEAGDKMDLYMYSTPWSYDALGNFESIRLSTADGGSVALSDVADVSFEYGPQSIRHVNGRRAVTLEIVPPKDMSLEEAVEKVEAEIIGPMKAKGLPPGYDIKIGGMSDKLTAIREKLSGDFALALALSWLVMVLVFRHFGHPLTVMLSIPVGLTGGVLGLALLNKYLAIISPGTIQSLDVLTMLGFVILLGSVINNPILIVQGAVDYKKQGRAWRDAIVEATLTRVRPIFMTTATTIFGLLPLVLNPGAGTELYRGLGVVMFGGLLIGTLNALFFIPCLMSLAVDTGERLESWRRKLAPTAGA